MPNGIGMPVGNYGGPVAAATAQPLLLSVTASIEQAMITVGNSLDRIREFNHRVLGEQPQVVADVGQKMDGGGYKAVGSDITAKLQSLHSLLNLLEQQTARLQQIG